jgi:hypothetical protein
MCACSVPSWAAKCKRKPCSANPVSMLVTIPVCTSGWVRSVPLISLSTGPKGWANNTAPCGESAHHAARRIGNCQEPRLEPNLSGSKLRLQQHVSAVAFLIDVHERTQRDAASVGRIRQPIPRGIICGFGFQQRALGEAGLPVGNGE